MLCRAVRNIEQGSLLDRSSWLWMVLGNSGWLSSVLNDSDWLCVIPKFSNTGQICKEDRVMRTQVNVGKLT